MSDIRDSKQDKIVETYLKYPKNRCTLVVPTGFGKSYIAMKIIKATKAEKVLILSNSTILRDESWKEQFEEFGMSDFYENNVMTATYQKAYKWTPEKVDLTGYFIIADEVDFSGGTDKLASFFDAYPDNKTLGLTGFISKSKKLWFRANMPVIYELSVEAAQRAKLLNEVKYVFIKYPMTDGESIQYANFDKRLKELNNASGNLAVDLTTGKISEQKYYEEMATIDRYIDATLRRRSSFLWSLKSAVKYSIKLLKHFHADIENPKSIVFSKLTEQSAKISKFVYNGKAKAKENREIFSKFSSSEIRNLGVVSKINRGVNIKGLNIGLWESYTSSDTQFMQQKGRLLRLHPDEMATLVILIPYYKSKDGEYLPTQAINWVKKMIGPKKKTHVSTWSYI